MTLTKQETESILKASARTMNYISEALESDDIDIAIEMVVDADRMLTCGELDPELHAKFQSFSYPDIVAFMKSNKFHWY